MTTLDTLRKLAQAATPGPFVVVEMGNEDECITRTVNTFAASRGREVAIITTGDFPDDQEARNAAYIAACSPERILAMIAVIEAAKAMGTAGVFDDTAAWATIQTVIYAMPLKHSTPRWPRWRETNEHRNRNDGDAQGTLLRST